MSRSTVYRSLRRRLTDTYASLSRTISAADKDSPVSVLSSLETIIQALWSNGPLFAQDIGDNIQFNCEYDPAMPVHVYVSSGSIKKHQATQCSWTAALIGLLVAHPDRETTSKVQRFIDWKDLSSCTRNLTEAVIEAKADADQGKTTFLIVCLRDVGFQNQSIENYDERYDYQSLTHYFVLGIEKDGWKVYMSYVNLYDLDQQLKMNPEKLSWKDMHIFLDAVDKLTEFKGMWEDGLSNIYNSLFHVDVKEHAKCHDKELVQVWDLDVFVMSLKDVKAENLLKFKWVL